MDWHQYFYYEPNTGLLRWRVSRGKVKAGDEAGCLAKTCGYRLVRLKGKLYLTHRIVWDMLYPENKLAHGEEVDHIDHDRVNNRLSNLRKVKHSENMRNQTKPKNNTSGATGVHWDKRKHRWWAYLYKDGKTTHVGYFVDFDKAVLARKEALAKHNFHINHGE